MRSPDGAPMGSMPGMPSPGATGRPPDMAMARPGGKKEVTRGTGAAAGMVGGGGAAAAVDVEAPAHVQGKAQELCSQPAGGHIACKRHKE